MPLRVVGGQLRGRKLRTVPGLATRPTADRTREAIFNILGPVVRGAHVLDLFAGTGAFGIEALSRGAGFSVFVERGRDALTVLKGNIAACGLIARTRVLGLDALKSLEGLTHAAPKLNLPAASGGESSTARNESFFDSLAVPAASGGDGARYLRFSLVFLDPPYHRHMIAPALANLNTAGCLERGAEIVAEHGADDPLDEIDPSFRLRDRRRYGKTVVSFLNYVV
jgi:16S rRNA (guanine966-N2)-methyltransferase